VRLELVAALSSDLDALASSLQRSGAAGDSAGRLLAVTSAAVVEAVALSQLGHAPHRLGEAGRVYALHGQVETSPAQTLRILPA